MSRRPESPLADCWVSSPNCGPRSGRRVVDMLVLHYTATPTADYALQLLTEPDGKVSCHYLIDEDGRVVQIVSEADRAWHAGVSSWRGEEDINSCSIGIEIQNAATAESLRRFPDRQMRSVEALCLDVLSRHAIPPERILAHSDVAPRRKQDPGETFDWRRLSEAGIGLWFEADSPSAGDNDLGPKDSGERVLSLQRALAAVGYDLSPSGYYDADTEIIVSAFQRHWRQSRVDGVADKSTQKAVGRLLAIIGDDL